jgi:hypothetical protein
MTALDPKRTPPNVPCRDYVNRDFRAGLVHSMVIDSRGAAAWFIFLDFWNASVIVYRFCLIRDSDQLDWFISCLNAVKAAFQQ